MQFSVILRILPHLLYVEEEVLLVCRRYSQLILSPVDGADSKHKRNKNLNPKYHVAENKYIYNTDQICTNYLELVRLAYWV